MSKLLIIVIDGLMADTLACAHVPCFDTLAREGVLTTGHLPTGAPRLILPTLTTLFTSLVPDEHGVLTNSGAEPPASHAVSLFSLLRYRCLRASAFVSNDRLLRLFPAGSLHTALLINSQSIRNVDQELAKQAGWHLQQEKPDCCLIYLEGVSIAATCFGRNSEPCRESVEQADRILGILLEHLTMVGLREEYVIMVMGSCGSGRNQPEAAGEPAGPLLFAGPDIARREAGLSSVSLLDLAPTMATILGLAPHPEWRGRIEAGIFQPPPHLEIGGVTPRRRQTAATA